MKTFKITEYPIVGGIAVPVSHQERARTEKSLINKHLKVCLRFNISELAWIDGKRVTLESKLINKQQEYQNDQITTKPKQTSIKNNHERVNCNAYVVLGCYVSININSKGLT